MLDADLEILDGMHEPGRDESDEGAREYLLDDVADLKHVDSCLGHQHEYAGGHEDQVELVVNVQVHKLLPIGRYLRIEPVKVFTIK